MPSVQREVIARTKPSCTARALVAVILACACIVHVASSAVADDGLKQTPAAQPLADGRLRRLPFPPTAVPKANTNERVLDTSAGSDTLVYSNTLSTHVWDPGVPPGTFVADDIVALTDTLCTLDRVVVRVSGDADGSGNDLGNPFAVTMRLYSTCPGASFTSFPMVETSVSFPDGLVHDVILAPPPEVAIRFPRSVYVSLSFNRENTGILVGAPAMVGFSDDRIDTPSAPCAASFGGFPDQPHASFYAEVYVRGDCTPSFPVYHDAGPAGPPFTFGRRGSGGENTFAQNTTPVRSDCLMTGYDVLCTGTRFNSSGGVRVDLRTVLSNGDPLGGGIIPGSAKALTVFGDSLQVLRHRFVPPIPLPPFVWMTFSTTSDVVGPVLTDAPPSIGSAVNSLVRYVGDAPNGVWQPTNLPDGGVFSGFDITIYCAGTATVGACCDTVLTDDAGEAVCREVPEINCPVPTAWRQGAACAAICDGGDNDGLPCTRQVDCLGGECPGPFGGPCGLSACCTGDGQCQDLTLDACAALDPTGMPREFQAGRYCNVDKQACPAPSCYDATNECTTIGDFICFGGPDAGRRCDPLAPANAPACVGGDGLCASSPGCSDLSCCAKVCSRPSGVFCCDVHWDDGCVAAAEALCNAQFINDDCSASLEDDGAASVTIPSFVISNLSTATERAGDPGFCCHPNTPGAEGAATRWYKFVAPEPASIEDAFSSVTVIVDSLDAGASTTSDAVLIQFLAPADRDVGTCDDESPCSIQVGFCADGSTCTPDENFVCRSLVPVACNIRSTELSPETNEPVGTQATTCAARLVPGETYYLLFAAKDIAGKQSYRLTFLPGCASVEDLLLPDCNADGLPDVCAIAPIGSSPDCDGNGVPDECQPDCDENNEPDVCQLPPFTDEFDCDRNGVVDDCELDEWRIDALIKPSDPGDDEFFGYAVAVSDRNVVVGQPGDVSEVGRGRAYVYRKSGDEMIEEIILASDAEGVHDLFGYSVAVHGDTAIVGAPRTDFTGIGSGAAYVFRHIGGRWMREGVLTSDDSTRGDEFGIAVALDKDVALIGRTAFGTDTSEGGAVYLFRRDTDGWRQDVKLTASDGVIGDGFGFTVHMASDRIIVGARNVNAVYVFELVGGVWTETAKLIPEGERITEGFPASVAATDEHIVVGAVRCDAQGRLRQPGSTFVFRRSGANWIQEAVLTSDNPDDDDCFGVSVAAREATIAVGAHRENPFGFGSGVVYLFRQDMPESDWRLMTRLTGDDEKYGLALGFSVALDGNSLVVGATDTPIEIGNRTYYSAGAVLAFGLEYNDCDRDRIHNACETDVDSDGVPDSCDTCAGLANVDQDDCDNDGVGDVCAIADCPPDDSTCQDCNDNGIPDGCEPPLPLERLSTHYADSPTAGDDFGTSVAISGDTALVVTKRGVDLLQFRRGAWQPAGKLVPNTTLGSGRTTVAMAGGVAVVRTLQESFRAPAFVFEFDGMDWKATAVFELIESTSFRLDPRDIDTDGQRIVARAGFSRAVEVFQRTALGWIPEATITGIIQGSVSSILVNGDTIFVGDAVRHPCLECESTGVVVVLRYDGAAWTEEEILAPNDLADRALFGYAMAIHRDRLVVTAPDDSGGIAYVFRLVAGRWEQEQKLAARRSRSSSDRLGLAVAMSRDTIVMSSWRYQPPNQRQGAAIVFRHNGIEWTETEQVFRTDDDNSLGESVAVDGRFLIVGATLGSSTGLSGGSVNLYSLPSDCNGDGLPDECAAGDLDGSGRVDLDDFGRINTCLVGPSVGQLNTTWFNDDRCCSLGDFDSDGDLDLRDVAAFQQVFVGPE